MELAEQRAQSIHQASLFDSTESTMVAGLVLSAVQPWSEQERLLQEKAALGFYFSGHPFDSYADELGVFVKTRLDALQASPQPVLLAGVITSSRTQMTRRGKMAFILLDDGKGNVEIPIFNEQFERHRDWLKEDRLLLVEGKLSKDDYSGGLRVQVDKLYDLTTARTHYARWLKLSVSHELLSVNRLQTLLRPYCDEAAGCPIRLQYQLPQALTEMELGAGWKVVLHDELLVALRAEAITASVVYS
jgi:DNA polymerase-3 subunit alpha